MILHNGDCLEVMEEMAVRGEQVHSVICDPPYHLTSIVKRFANSTPPAYGTDGAYARAARGFMGKVWDGGDIAFRPDVWRLCAALLPPGGHLLAFGGTRTYHRLACAIEDAGFEIRDAVLWHYGTGFPKSHNVARGIDRALGVEGSFGAARTAAHAAWIERGALRSGRGQDGWQRPWMENPGQVANAARRYVPGSPEAEEWDGWGTALKPASEIIALARKPLEGTVAANVLAHDVGALNIDACMVHGGLRSLIGADYKAIQSAVFSGRMDGSLAGGSVNLGTTNEGRWPANLVHDGSDEVLAAFPDAPGQSGAVRGTELSVTGKNTYGEWGRVPSSTPRGDKGSAARFFYSAKASPSDRGEDNTHPTVKPTALMEWLVRLVTPPGGRVLDPFMGSGSTGKACMRTGMDFVGIEREVEYFRIAQRRLDLTPLHQLIGRYREEV